MLKQIGIETRLQMAITLCVAALVVVTTLGGSGGAPPVFFIYRTLLVVITILCAMGCRKAGFRLSRLFTALTGLALALMLISALRIPASHFDGFYLWYKHAFFVSAFLSLAWYSRFQSARWRGFLLGTVILTTVVHLLPDLLLNRQPVAGFSANNSNYFGTFLLIGFSASLAVALFGVPPVWRIAAAVTAALLLFGIMRTWSRGATMAAAVVILIAAVRAGSRIPRRVWLLVGLLAVVTIVATSPYLIQKFLDRGERDPYNYARAEVWLNSLRIIAERPLLGIGFGQYFHVSKRFAFPVEGVLARYLKRAQMAHSEYLQRAAESGIPATILFVSIFGYLLFLAWKRAERTWPEYRCFNEAAILTAAALGTHGIVDNCWTIPVMASGVVTLAMADLLPLREAGSRNSQKPERQKSWLLAAASGAVAAAIYVHSTAIPALGLYYNETGHQAFDRADFSTAEKYHLAAIAAVPDHPSFLDNLGMVYLQQFADTGNRDMLARSRGYFAQAMAAAPQSLDPHIHMETVLIRSLTGNLEQDLDLHKAIVETDRKLLAIDPFIPFARKNLAGSLYLLGERGQAFEELKKAIEYEPNYVPGYLQLGVWYRELGKNAESEHYTATGITIVTKYRNYKPREAYEGVLLARPEGSWNVNK